jgi:hypothetical protein
MIKQVQAVIDSISNKPSVSGKDLIGKLTDLPFVYIIGTFVL